MLGSLCLSAGVPVHQQYLCHGHLGGLSNTLPILPSPRCRKTIQKDELKNGGPSRNKETLCKRGCIDAASFAVPWTEGTGSTSSGSFTILRHQETFLVFPKCWEQQHGCKEGKAASLESSLDMDCSWPWSLPPSTQVPSVFLCSVHSSLAF